MPEEVILIFPCARTQIGRSRYRWPRAGHFIIVCRTGIEATRRRTSTLFPPPLQHPDQRARRSQTSTAEEPLFSRKLDDDSSWMGRFLTLDLANPLQVLMPILRVVSPSSSSMQSHGRKSPKDHIVSPACKTPPQSPNARGANESPISGWQFGGRNEAARGLARVCQTKRAGGADVLAQLMGHAKVDTTLNVYTQVVDGALRRAADVVGSDLLTIVHRRLDGLRRP
jgi:hypothetical protein